MVNEQVRLINLIDDIASGKDVFFRSVRFVEDVMTENVKTLTLDDTIETCLKCMKENHIRHIPVIDSLTGEDENPYLVGIVSERDVFRQVSPYLGKIGQTDSDLKAMRQPLVQIITRDPKFVSPETPIADTVAIMVDNHIDSVPVLSGQNLLGIITSSDILRLFTRLNAIRQLCRKEQEKTRGKHLIDLLCGNSDDLMSRFSSVLRTVEDIMTDQVVCLDEKENLTRAIEVMQKGKLRHVPIVGKAEKLVGIISDRDILRHLPFRSGQLRSKGKAFRDRLFDIASNEPALKQTVSHIMKCNPVHVLPDCDFYTVVKMLNETKISCLPVVHNEKKLVGIVTVTDVMRGLLAIYALLEKSVTNVKSVATVKLS